jgi:DNA-directed RNA polymerase subunit M/transcription elongation factor TFIIS
MWTTTNEIKKKCRDLTTKQLKDKAIERDKFKCQKCGKEENLQIHHTRYRIPPQLNDLITLCDICHPIINVKVKDTICELCLSAQTYRTKKQIVCRRCGYKKQLKEEKDKKSWDDSRRK